MMPDPLKKNQFTLVVVDDHEIFQEGLKSLVKGFEHLKIIGSLKDGKQLEDFLEKNTPDIIIMDIDMPVMDGVSSTRYVKTYFPDIKVIVLSMYSDGFTVEKAFKAGADAYLTKSITKKIFSEAIQAVINHQNYISNDAAINYSLNRLTSHNKEPSFQGELVRSKPFNNFDLTEREISVAKFIAQGYSNKQIADIINLSHRTIETHRFNLMKKLKVKNSGELVKLLISMNLIE